MSSKELFRLFSKPKYFLIAIISAIIFYSLNILVTSFYLIIYYFRNNTFLEASKLFTKLFRGFYWTIPRWSFVTLVLISLMIGILIGLISYKASLKIKGNNLGALGTFGLMLGILAPGCAACGLGLIAALGLTAAVISFLPLKGLEISLLAIAILGFAIFKISRDIEKCEVCKVNLPYFQKNERRSK